MDFSPGNAQQEASRKYRCYFRQFDSFVPRQSPTSSKFQVPVRPTATVRPQLSLDYYRVPAADLGQGRYLHMLYSCLAADKYSSGK